MIDLKDLYQETILEHNSNPRNVGTVEGATHRAEGNNPLCGDRITVTAKMTGGKIEDIKFEGQGCAISQASASIMSGLLKGKTKAHALKLFQQFIALVTGKRKGSLDKMGSLAVFAGVADYPTRVKCASLAWHTMKSALQNKKTVTTE